MTLTLREGGYYLTANGQKVGPLCVSKSNNVWPWNVYDQRYKNGCIYWSRTGDRMCFGDADHTDPGFLITAEWQDPETNGPVRRRTVTEIAPGVYGRVEVDHGRSGTFISITGNGSAFTRAELRAAIATLTQIADALDEQGGAK